MTSLGLGVVSVPLFKGGQQIAGALGLAFASHRVSTDEELGPVAAMHDAARAPSQRLGSQVYPFGSGNAPRTD